MYNKYVFDVDGTLTPSRGIMDEEFKDWFKDFSSRNDIYIVTGSDKQKTIEQIGLDVWSLARRVYQCSGNDVWEEGVNTRVNMIDLTPDMEAFFESWLIASEFPLRTGTHVDIRPGLINFSILGRGATRSQRDEYVLYDTKMKERTKIAENFNERFSPVYEAQVAGETGLDIVKRGYGKVQIIHDFSPHDKLHFFGDKIQPNGNDYELALEIANSGGNVYSVKDWKETWEHLKRL